MLRRSLGRSVRTFSTLIGIVGTLCASAIALVIVYLVENLSAALAVAIATCVITGGAFVYGGWSAGRRHKPTTTDD